MGHIFQLGDKYSEAMKLLEVLDSNGKNVNPYEGYGDWYLENEEAIAIEQNHDDKGIIWPSAISPFEILIIVLNDKDDSNVMDQAMNIYDELRSDGIDVLR